MFRSTKYTFVFFKGELCYEIIALWTDVNVRYTTGRYSVCIIYCGLCTQCLVSCPCPTADLLVHFVLCSHPHSPLVTNILLSISMNLFSVCFYLCVLLSLVISYGNKITWFPSSSSWHISLNGVERDHKGQIHRINVRFVPLVNSRAGGSWLNAALKFPMLSAKHPSPD